MYSKKNRDYIFKMILIFSIGSFLGTIWEACLDFIHNLFHHERILFSLHNGVLFGPFNPLYGFGIVLSIFLFGDKKIKTWKLLLYGALLGGALEYLGSLILEYIFGIESWNYHKCFLNINGRTGIPFMLVWGIGVLIIVKFLYPYLSRWIDKIDQKAKVFLVFFFSFFLSIDIAISGLTLVRANLHRHGYKPISPIGEFLDKTYSDEYLKKRFKNMKIIK